MGKLWQDFNINHHVRVKLTEYGREKHREQHDTFWKSTGSTPPIYTPPTEDSEGWSDWQLWTLMQDLGSLVSMGGNLPFDTQIQFEREE